MVAQASVETDGLGFLFRFWGKDCRKLGGKGELVI